MELDWEEPGSRVWAVSLQATMLGGPVADARSWLASENNLVTTEKTLILRELMSPQTLAWLGSPWLGAFPGEKSGKGMGGERRKGSSELK